MSAEATGETLRQVKGLVRSLNLKKDPVDRHFCLLETVDLAYSGRANPELAAECARIAEMHLAEFEQIAPALLREFGLMPHVPTFEKYATLLSEQGDFERAVWVCQLGLYYGLDDRTKSGFNGRIERIRKKQLQART
jgi:hypothetical protein